MTDDTGPYVIRSLGPGDAAALSAFYNSLSPASIRMFRPLGSCTTLDVCTSLVADSTGPGPTRVDLVACDGPGIVGWGFLCRLDGDQPSLGLGVLDGHQGRRLGARLLDGVLALARQRQLPVVYLIAVEDNARAIRLYQSRGFRQYGQHIGEQDGLPYVRMSVEMHGTAATPR
jgi:GNAT superfamily N-acetyltransferase